MIGIKGGTQTWSSSPQRPDFQSDGAQTLSATDRQRALGDESVGDVLNKVADPNYVDTSKKMRTVGNNQLGKDAFMTLLLTQMKNQDPTNPLKSHEMAAQLAQFTSLEKLNNISEGIDGLRKDQQPSHNFEALSFIGKTISTDNSKLSRSDKDAQHEIRFTLPGDAQKMTLQVKDAEGRVVRTLDFKNLKTGKNELNWNGLTDEGGQAPPGEYTVAFEAVGSNGRKLFVETKTEGVISGVNFTPQGPQLLVGKQAVNMSEVKSISDPGASGVAPFPTQPLGVPQTPGGASALPNSVPVPSVQIPPADSATARPARPESMRDFMAPVSGSPMGALAAAAPGMNSMSASYPSTANSAPADPGRNPTQSKGPRKAEVKPEAKANAEKAAKMKGSDLNDAAMAQGLINKLNRDGAKAGMEG